jgi:hypothetical protein
MFERIVKYEKKLAGLNVPRSALAKAWPTMATTMAIATRPLSTWIIPTPPVAGLCRS